MTAKDGEKGPQRVGDLISRVLEESGHRIQVARMGVLEEWGEIVGERIAGVSRPRSVHDATLVVEVRSSAWLMELNMMKREILERLNQGREDAPIDKIVFVLGEDVE